MTRARDTTATMLGFVRALRAGGLRADTGRLHGFITALDTLDVLDPESVYWAGRLTLCAEPEDLARYDACFAHYFSAHTPRRVTASTPVTVVEPVTRHTRPEDRTRGEDTPVVRAGAASDVEVLRSRDIALLTDAERAEVWRMLERLVTRRERRRTRRLTRARRGRLDYGSTVRAAVRHGGEPLRLRWRARATRPRRVVLLVDISGSMSPYADAFLRLAHVLLRGHPDHTEVFSVGTRLTRLTRQLRGNDAGAAMRAAGAAIPDWSGGTRLGGELKEFLDRHGRRGAVRGAVVVIASDGWERGDASLLAEQMARLSRLASRTVWVNPHKGQPGYRPLTAGMRAALPHIDDFVSGHSAAALEESVTAVIGGDRGGGARA